MVTAIPLAPIIATAADGELRAIPLNQLHTSATNPRKDITDASVEELTASIDQQGQLQPFLVRELRDECFEVVAGNRRLRAQQLRRDRGKLTRDDLMMCVLRELTDQQVLEMQITENLQRQDVHPMDEAEGYRKLLEMAGDGDEGSRVEALAKKLGKSKSFVWQRLKLADLAPKAAKLFREGRLTTSHAIDCARLTPADQARYVEEFGRYHGGEGASVRSMRAWIGRHVRIDLAKAPFSVKDDRLVKEAGACVDCSKCSGARPELFDGLNRDDVDQWGNAQKDKSDKPLLVCLDAGCYQGKVHAFALRKAQQLREEYGFSPVLVWGGDHYERPRSGCESKLPTHAEFSTAKKADDCPHTKLAIVAGGKNIGQKLFICQKNGCEVHKRHFSSASNSNDDSRQRQAETQRKVRLENQARALAFRAILHGVNGKKCPIEDLRAIALAHLEEMVHDTTVHMGKALGWADRVKGNGQYRDLMKAAIRQAPTKGRVLWLMLAMTLARDVTANTWGGDSLTKGAELLHAIGGRYHVDLAKIRADLQSADKTKREAKGKKDREKKLKLAQESKRKLRDLAKETSADATPTKALSSQGRKRMAEMMKLRWAERKAKAKGATAA